MANAFEMQSYQSCWYQTRWKSQFLRRWISPSWW